MRKWRIQIIDQGSHLRLLAGLLRASQDEGQRLVQRLIDDWHTGDNRFDGEGELLLLAILGETPLGNATSATVETVIGVCGLNADPYEPDANFGRVRHLYVLPNWRRQGVGRGLVRRVIKCACAGERFDRLQLRTHSAEAGRFYCHLGFSQVMHHPHCTHVLERENFPSANSV